MKPNIIDLNGKKYDRDEIFEMLRKENEKLRKEIKRLKNDNEYIHQMKDVEIVTRN